MAANDMVWQTVNDGQVCEGDIFNSCEPRHGEVHTMEEWDGLGWPGAPQLLCSVYSKSGISRCRCVLLFSTDAEATSVDASAAIQAGRDRARAELGNS